MLSWISRLSISRKLWLVLGVFSVLLAWISWDSYSSQQEMADWIARIKTENFQRNDLLRKTDEEFLLIRLTVRDMLLATSNPDGQASRAAFDRHEAAFDDLVRQLGTAGLPQQELDGIVQAKTAYTAELRQLMARIGAGKHPEALALLHGAMAGQGNKLQNQIGHAMAEQEQQLDAVLRAANDSVTGSIRLILFSLLIGAGGTIPLAGWIILMISRSVRQSASVLAQIADGDGDLTQRLPVVSGDEVGALATNFNRFVTSLNRIIGEAAHLSEDVSATSQNLSGATDDLVQAMSQVTAAIDHTAHTSSEQASLIQNQTGTMRQMHDAAADVAASAEHAAQAANQAADAARTGAEALNSATGRIRGLYTTIQQTNQTIVELGTLSEQIGNIVAMIRSIASQTNLLALNAAIEAARAGEQGRGFSVVAAEVRKLAADSARSAEAIATMIADVQSGTRRAVAAMENGQQEADVSVQAISQCQTAFQDIVQAIARSDAETASISAAVNQLASGLESVAGNMEQIATLAEQNAAATQEVTAATEEQNATIQQVAGMAVDLAKAAEDLHTSVGGFITEAAPTLAPVAPQRQLIGVA